MQDMANLPSRVDLPDQPWRQLQAAQIGLFGNPGAAPAMSILVSNWQRWLLIQIDELEKRSYTQFFPNLRPMKFDGFYTRGC
jgi:hypothetical protein